MDTDRLRNRGQRQIRLGSNWQTVIEVGRQGVVMVLEDQLEKISKVCGMEGREA